MTSDDFTTAKRFETGVIVSAVAWIVYLTALSLVLRSITDLMAMGGSCGSGSRVPCPVRIAVFMPIGIPAMIVAVFVHAIGAKGWGPSLAAFFWPVLFTSLGVTFIVSAQDAPVAPLGYALGAMFILMSASPFLVFRAIQRGPAWFGWKALGLRHEDDPGGNNLLAGLIFLACCAAFSLSLAGFVFSVL